MKRDAVNLRAQPPRRGSALDDAASDVGGVAALCVLEVVAEDSVHAHFSPPCVAISSPRHERESKASVELGVRLYHRH